MSSPRQGNALHMLKRRCWFMLVAGSYLVHTVHPKTVPTISTPRPVRAGTNRTQDQLIVLETNKVKQRYLSFNSSSPLPPPVRKSTTVLRAHRECFPPRFCALKMDDPGLPSKYAGIGESFLPTQQAHTNTRPTPAWCWMGTTCSWHAPRPPYSWTSRGRMRGVGATCTAPKTHGRPTRMTSPEYCKIAAG
jgi:hypothetical protein